MWNAQLSLFWWQHFQAFDLLDHCFVSAFVRDSRNPLLVCKGNENAENVLHARIYTLLVALILLLKLKKIQCYDFYNHTIHQWSINFNQYSWNTFDFTTSTYTIYYFTTFFFFKYLFLHPLWRTKQIVLSALKNDQNLIISLEFMMKTMCQGTLF